MYSRIRRFLKHRWLDASTTRRVIPADLVQRLAKRVAASEQRHSGEIRIYVEAGLPAALLLLKLSTPQIVRQRALSVFSELRVWDTAGNNGVLIYLLLAERSIEIVADRGLNDRVTAQTWKAMVSRMSKAFATGRFEDGLTEALEEVSALLVQHFPLDSGANPNELPNAPILG
ncbi:MAG: TPM domain-containing protein [Rhodoferax sp.]